MRWAAFALFLLLPIAACTPRTPLTIEDVWTRDTVGSSANAAIYMTIRSPTPDRLIGASTPVANETDLMTMESGDGAMRMTYVDAIDIPANTPVSLNPRGLHIWAADLNRPLSAGQSFPLVLEFERAGRRQVIVSIIQPAAPPPMSGM